MTESQPLSDAVSANREPDGVEQPPQLVIRPSSGWSALDLKQIWLYRDLLMTLAGRDVKLRYRQTALGAIWVILQPLVAAGIFSFVFGKVLKVPTVAGLPYFLLSYTGQLAWNAFNSTLTKSSGVLVQNSNLISKVYFPRLVLPFSTVPSSLLDFAVALAIVPFLLLFYHITPGIGFLLFPLWIALILMIAVGIGLYTSALTVSYRDVQFILPVAVQMLFYASPVAYMGSLVPEKYRLFYSLNPLSSLIEAFRWSLTGFGELNWGAVAYAATFAILVLIGGAFAFKKMERKFADVI